MELCGNSTGLADKCRDFNGRTEISHSVAINRIHDVRLKTKSDRVDSDAGQLRDGPDPRGFCGIVRDGPWRRISSALDAGDAPGVYVLIWNERAIYVGQSLRLVERLRSHKWSFLSDGIRADGRFYPGATVKVRDCRRFGEWLMIEARLIRRLQPMLNVRRMTRAVMSARVQPEVIDLSVLDFSKPSRQAPEPARPLAWGYRPCLCGLAHEMSFERPRVECFCGRSLELNVPSAPNGGTQSEQ